jgi:hypothetical protein
LGGVLRFLAPFTSAPLGRKALLIAENVLKDARIRLSASFAEARALG